MYSEDPLQKSKLNFKLLQEMYENSFPELGNIRVKIIYSTLVQPYTIVFHMLLNM